MNIINLNNRAREVFKHIVENYLSSGEAVSSRTISKISGLSLSSATIRNIMSDLEDFGLLFSKHTSAGRTPSLTGLQFFVDSLMTIKQVSFDEQHKIKEAVTSQNSIDKLLDSACSNLSNLSQMAGLVVSPKSKNLIKHIELVKLSNDQALAILVTDEGLVENRIINLSKDITMPILNEANRFINHFLQNKSFNELQEIINTEINSHKQELSELSKEVVETGLAELVNNKSEIGNPIYIVKGQNLLFKGIDTLSSLERLRELSELLEKKQTISKILKAAQNATGVKIFIGSKNSLFVNSGCSAIFAPLRKKKNNEMIGAIGVVGPIRINYAQIIPLVDFTAEVISNNMQLNRQD